MIIFTLALTVLLGFAALAIDMNHVVLNKARVQNSVDAAALAAAVVADSGKTTQEIANAALDSVKNYSSSAGNSEIAVTQNAVFGAGGSSLSLPLSDSATILIQFSNDPTVFPSSSFQRKNASGEFNDVYVRVQVTGVALDGFFVGLFNVNKSVSASAVAGPSSSVSSSSELCNLVPMAVCAKDSSDDEFGGYSDGDYQVLKESSWKDSDFNTPGNFQLLNFTGINDVAEQLAGGYDGCLSEGSVSVSTGVKGGLVKDGLNTRFGDYQGHNMSESDYPPDIYIKQANINTDDDGNITSDFTYVDYQQDIADGNYTEESGGVPGRRLLSVPIIDCSNNIGSGNGSGSNAEFNVVSVGCFFLSKKAPSNNSQNEPQIVYGEFNSDCLVNNATFPTTPSASGAYKIQLYKDPNSSGV
ncbi:Tad domain-containing protein [Vibrio neonatus]